MIKSLFKRSLLWKRIKNSSLYFRLLDPSGYDKYEQELMFYKFLLKKHSSKNHLIFDVGANMGRKSFFFSKISKKVIAFEPSQRLFNFLSKRFAGSNVEVLQYALSSEPGLKNFFITETNQAYNSLSEKHIKTTASNSGVANGEITTAKVETRTLDYFIENYGIPKYIKIDVEGHEEEVIQGLKMPVPIISFEANLPDFYDETIRILSYLNEISSGNYVCNCSAESLFIYDNFLSIIELKKILRSEQLGYIEIFAVMKE
ncbi:FkbM family methyltransferase [Gramella sp. Hel_I_59]|uniref:FkbM family methyltransferase n=1 Tax=Gramella sp. Hel_I_59 TaxID=1249978 RepID=UPI00114F810C|nr:FkbM family methyltransferase [Gramella sp. Hel_I_59]TQI71536.1 FkbM family methyltransferase [Gramella sp. Hel_I_59]